MTKLQLVSAEAMAAAVASDPQLHLPQHPRFVPGLVILALPDALLVEGTADRQVFRGRAATILLPRLIPLLDGSRTVTELAASLPDVPFSAVNNAVSLLFTRGLLEEGDPRASPEPTAVAGDALAFLERHIDVTRVNHSRAEIAARLQSANVVVIGDARLGTLLCQGLQGMGITQATVSDATSLLPECTLAVALAAGPEDLVPFAEIDERCGRLAIPWLRTVCTSEWMELGPCFDKEETCCYDCFHASLDSADFGTPPDLFRERQWLGVLAAEIVYLVSRVCEATSLQSVRRLSFADWAQTQWRPAVQPGCERCCPLPGERRRPAEPAFAFEQSVRFESWRRLNPKDHQQHYKVANIHMQHNHKHYPSGRLVQLPQGWDSAASRPDTDCLTTEQRTPGSRTPLDIARLASIVLLAGGIREHAQRKDQKVQRWAPTGGNFGSAQFYVLAQALDGLEPGRYYYDPFEHALVELPRQQTPGDWNPVSGGTAGLFVGADAVLVMTAALTRVTYKYGPFGLRVAHFDAGVALAQLQAAADSVGIEAQWVLQLGEEPIARDLGIDLEHEPIMGAVALYGRNA